MNNSLEDAFIIDTHAHLDMLKSISPHEALEKAKDAGVRYIINIGSSIKGSDKSVEYSNKFKEVYSAVGVHPHEAEKFSKKELQHLEELIIKDENKKIVAIGETGFDMFRNLSPEKDQESAFRDHIELALKYDLPIIIHNREADAKTLQILKEYISKSLRGVVHCFSGDIDFADKCMDLGLFISFTGVITYPKTDKLLEVVKKIPLERMFVETDCPFLSPQVFRGKENHPANVYYIAQRISEIKGISISKVAAITSKNAMDFFGLG